MCLIKDEIKILAAAFFIKQRSRNYEMSDVALPDDFDMHITHTSTAESSCSCHALLCLSDLNRVLCCMGTELLYCAVPSSHRS